MAGIAIVPDPLVLKGDLAKNYKIFEDQFNKFFESKKYLHEVAENEKITFFLTTMGKDARELYKSFNLPSDDSVTLKAVMERYRVYCDSFKDSSVYHSFKFYSRNQQKGESFECYLKDVFELAKPCHFNYDRETIERLIRDKVILGLSNSSIREEIFNKGFTKLEEIVNYCLTKEKNEPETKIENIQEHSLVNKEDEKVVEEPGKGEKAEEENQKQKDDESDNDKNSGNTVTSSNDVLSTSVEPVTHDNKMEISNDYDDSILEKGEVSTSSFFDNIVENNPASPHGNKLQNIVIKQEISDTDSSVGIKKEFISIESKSLKQNDEMNKASNSVEKKKSANDDSDLEVITIDSSDSGEDKKGKPIPNSCKKPKVEIIKKKTSLIQVKKFFKCGKCGREFDLKQDLFSHITHCSANKPALPMKLLKCSLCAKIFGSQRSLDVHFASHRTSKSYSCDACGKHFDRESKLSGHKAVSHNVKGIVYACSKCPKKFNDEDVLRLHEVEHKSSRSSSGNNSSSSEEGLFKCALCRKNFKDYISLANHKHF